MSWHQVGTLSRLSCVNLEGQSFHFLFCEMGR
jgi:hypothetical protein